MAVPTVTARPATWSGTSGPILYKFTSTNQAEANFKLVVRLYVDAVLFDELEFSANPTTGAVVADMSPLIKKALAISSDSDLTTIDLVYLDTNSNVYYIKYQETWTGSSEAETDDVANLRFAIRGGLQLGNINDMSAYSVDTVAKKFLTYIDRLSGVTGKPSLISVIAQNFRAEFSGDMTIPAQSAQSFSTGWATAVLANGGQTLSRTNDTTLQLVSTATGTVYVAMPIIVDNNAAVTLNMNLTNVAGFGGTRIRLGLFAADLTTRLSTNTVNTDAVLAGGASASKTFIVNAPATGSEGVAYLVLESIYISTTFTYDLIMNAYPEVVVPEQLGVSIARSPSFVNDRCYRLKLPEGTESFKLIAPTTSTAKSETKYIDYRQPCNEKQLTWKNTLGGDECYPFQYNQKKRVQFGNDYKAYRFQCFAEQLTLFQWEAIQDMMGIGELHRTPLVEMISGTPLSARRNGQVVYEILSGAAKKEVVAILNGQETNTESIYHTAQVIVEEPELLMQ